ncbi:MAG: NUDIX domain-containing protein [Actinomycetota bacterium]
MSFEGSTLWRLRRQVGHDLILWPGATVLVEDAEGRVLLGRRRDNGEWAMPGGGAEEGSSFTSTALTELHEEASLEADRADLIAFASVSDPKDHVVRYPDGDVTHYFGIWFVLRRWRGEPVADGDELLELGWFSRDALPTPLMHSSAVAFAHYARYLETGAFQTG